MACDPLVRFVLHFTPRTYVIQRTAPTETLPAKKKHLPSQCLVCGSAPTRCQSLTYHKVNHICLPIGHTGAFWTLTVDFTKAHPLLASAEVYDRPGCIYVVFPLTSTLTLELCRGPVYY